MCVCTLPIRSHAGEETHSITNESMLRSALQELILHEVFLKGDILEKICNASTSSSVAYNAPSESLSKIYWDNANDTQKELKANAEAIISNRIKRWYTRRGVIATIQMASLATFTNLWFFGEKKWYLRGLFMSRFGQMKFNDREEKYVFCSRCPSMSETSAPLYPPDHELYTLLNTVTGIPLLQGCAYSMYRWVCEVWNMSAIMFSKLEIPSMQLLTQYAAYAPLISKDLKEMTNELFRHYWSDPQPANLDKIKRLIDVCMYLPLTWWNQRSNPEKLTAFVKYAPETQEGLQHVYNRFSKEKKKKRGRRFPYYLVGEPGTGKTYAVEKLAEALDLPLIKLSFEGASVTDITGRNLDDPDATAGRIIEAFVHAAKKSHTGRSFKNSIIFIDEFDKLLRASSNNSEETLAFVLKLFDPENLSFTNNFLGTTIDLKDAIIFVAGNYDLRERALKNRFKEIEFKGFTKKGKMELVREDILPKLLTAYDVSEQEVSLDRFYSMVDQFIQKEDTDPGLRSVMKYCEYVFDKLTEEEVD